MEDESRRTNQKKAASKDVIPLEPLEEVLISEAVVISDRLDVTSRDDTWLNALVNQIRTTYFADVVQTYPIVAHFGRRAHRRFGSIGARNHTSILRLNGLLADPAVPLYVVEAVIAHELAHYAHGFGSGSKQRYAAPHRGGVVDKELEQRGLAPLADRAKAWIESEWEAFYQSRCADLLRAAHVKQKANEVLWQEFLAAPGRRTLADIQEEMADLAARVGFFRPLPKVDWLFATQRQKAPSYWQSKQQVLHLHGLLADRRVPNYFVQFQIAYWLVRQKEGAPWSAIQPKLWEAGLRSVTQQALNWRPRWSLFVQRYHPHKKAK
ncbi:hypothetical protein CTKA_01558 [Chthonomonas calidirosea]|uniref:Uncharacterized protein n=1 Tax=Chthonomonas calidirosea (strain DSM 23976 / ICMP 18418 / T49) TaxID=1303518 RepID=S0F015_CHTCT|nr:M48 family metallopeptidase [Chthonomonas calidirosea]CCW36330.1 hypothetical protein CCALI_02533 [Chthonomonas calidirosea T49]CEK17653.1 hypothetical protein CTKA_01558 [Chthonomonas calidirosea]